MVFYNRSNEAAALLKPGDFDWEAIFAGGVRWFHSGGIFAALSPTTPEVIIEAMQAAKAQGAVVSFDLNFREKLWKISGGADKRRRGGARGSSRTSTCWSATRRTCRRASASPVPRSPRSRSSTRARSSAMIDKVVAQHPHVKVVATTLREVHSTSRHTWSAVAWVNGKTHVAPTAELDVLDRVGGGDGFASGFFYGLLTRRAAARRR